MTQNFQIPPGMIGKFAVVKLWPNIKAAEDENVARMKRTAASLGLTCVEITPNGCLLDAPYTKLTQADVDFVIHLHFETPKTYDIFSFVALWNPIQFYHDWGYSRFSRHLLTHDDYLSCSSTGTDDHIRRMTAFDPTRNAPRFTMYHSLSEPIYEPTLGDKKIFYCGINWERLGKKKGRHQDLLDRLDPTGNLRIFGPRMFQGVNVWEGYESYEGPIPFDGVSMLKEINRAGIALVLSSDAHKESELMSNRLFESLAGGAFIICDENPFAKRFFGDCLLYFDATAPVDEAYWAIMNHVQWIKANPDDALKMARRAQGIFLERFSLDKSLANIYTNLPQRRKQLESLYSPADPDQAVCLLCLMPRYDAEVLARHIRNAASQRHPGCRSILLVDEEDLQTYGDEIRQAIKESGATLQIFPVTYTVRKGGVSYSRRLGQVMSDALAGDLVPADAMFAFVAPDEELFSEHVQTLAGALDREPEAQAAFANVVYRRQEDGTTYHDLQEELDYLNYASHRPLCWSRFLFRRSAFADHIHSTLPYVDARAMALLVATCKKRVPTLRASIIADIQSSFNCEMNPNVGHEMEVICDYLPWLRSGAKINGDAQPAALLNLDQLEPTSLSLRRLSEVNRQAIAIDLAHSVPIPSVLNKIVFGTYRFWLHRSK